MKFKVSPKIFADYPKLLIGVVVAKGVDNTGTNPEIATLLRLAEESLRKEFESVEVSQHQHIKPWREAYRKFGAKPRQYRCSSEALAKLVLKGVQIRSFNKLVDLYNYISLKHILTLGGEDLDKMKGDLVLDYATGNEAFIPLGTQESSPPKPGEVVYKDDLGVICRRWNWREGDRTKLTEQTKNAVLVLESLPPIKRETVEQATKELAELIQKYCGGETQSLFVDRDAPEVEL